jgi:hypothetical protein
MTRMTRMTQIQIRVNLRHLCHLSHLCAKNPNYIPYKLFLTHPLAGYLARRLDR